MLGERGGCGGAQSVWWGECGSHCYTVCEKRKLDVVITTAHAATMAMASIVRWRS